ncbi:hypothetical protein CH252_24555 [Rhodococcus sp. 06-1477-1B]|nr:hypothetical protein CH252_24555 [Rhodococcus sp. 06-1477-1B]
MEQQILTAVLSGTAIGALVTGLFSVAKPIIDYWMAILTRRWNQKLSRRAVVEGVVDQLRKVRVALYESSREGDSLSYGLVLQAADSALLIDDQEFAKYLSMDIENTSGFRVLYDHKLDLGEYDGDPAEGARAARWQHLKQLVERASAFAVTGKWEKSWASEARTLEAEMIAADKAQHPENR